MSPSIILLLNNASFNREDYLQYILFPPCNLTLLLYFPATTYSVFVFIRMWTRSRTFWQCESAALIHCCGSVFYLCGKQHWTWWMSSCACDMINCITNIWKIYLFVEFLSTDGHLEALCWQRLVSFGKKHICGGSVLSFHFCALSYVHHLKIRNLWNNFTLFDVLVMIYYYVTCKDSQAYCWNRTPAIFSLFNPYLGYILSDPFGELVHR